MLNKMRINKKGSLSNKFLQSHNFTAVNQFLSERLIIEKSGGRSDREINQLLKVTSGIKKY